MTHAPALTVLFSLTCLACTGDKGSTGADGDPDERLVAVRLAEDTDFENRVAALIEDRVAQQIFLLHRNALTGPDGPQGEQGQPGEMGSQGEPGMQGEPGLKGMDATRWKVCGISRAKTADDAGFTNCSDEEQCTSARICTVDELLAGSISHLNNSTANGSHQTNYLRTVGEQLIADGTIDAENPYAFAHSGFWATSCQNYDEDGAATKEAFSDELVELKATVWPFVQLNPVSMQEDNSSPNSVSARLAPCSITAPVICCDADGRPEVLPPQE